ncbi:MAG: hypothetical protein OEV30_00310 [Ignavibacteria bacterium]|nr:hypothetical protein [Ignavibacteria bacterium]
MILPGGFSRGQESRLIQFELEDQFGRLYTEQNWNDSILVIIGADRGGSEFTGRWGKALLDSIGTSVAGTPVSYVGLSDLDAVPFFMTGLVRSKFPDDPDEWVLMDWDGEFPDAYHFTEGATNILVFNLKRELIHRTAGREIESGTLDRLIQSIRSAAGQKPESPTDG